VPDRARRRAITPKRRCLHCGTPFEPAGSAQAFCSATCCWASEDLRRATEQALPDVVASNKRVRNGRRSWFARLGAMRTGIDEAAVVRAMWIAGASVRQIERYTVLDRRKVERLLNQTRLPGSLVGR
jgi:hypothetical protein